eukprot:m.313533 g.313533  ORF g.313533 m.313533 type:complete len:741 (-) comp16491_c1_seq1:18-2240(-)
MRFFSRKEAVLCIVTWFMMPMSCTPEVVTLEKFIKPTTGDGTYHLCYEQCDHVINDCPHITNQAFKNGVCKLDSISDAPINTASCKLKKPWLYDPYTGKLYNRSLTSQMQNQFDGCCEACREFCREYTCAVSGEKCKKCHSGPLSETGQHDCGCMLSEFTGGSDITTTTITTTTTKTITTATTTTITTVTISKTFTTVTTSTVTTSSSLTTKTSSTTSSSETTRSTVTSSSTISSFTTTSETSTSATDTTRTSSTSSLSYVPTTSSSVTAYTTSSSVTQPIGSTGAPGTTDVNGNTAAQPTTDANGNTAAPVTSTDGGTGNFDGSSDDGSSNASTGAIIGAVIAVILVAICIIFGVFYFKRSQKEKTVFDMVEGDVEVVRYPNPTYEGAEHQRKEQKLQLGGMFLDKLDVDRFNNMDTNSATVEALPVEIAKRIKEFNRYKNILPNPRTRVILNEVDGDPTSSFINANFVDGADGATQRYIAAQGPKATTIGHFWRMIWEKNVRAIVMVTALKEGKKEKCARYWPRRVYDEAEDKDYEEYDGIKVMVITGEIDAGYKVAELDVSLGSETRRIVHFWFDSWPDYGLPSEPLAVPRMLRHVRERSDKLDEPWLVHCSAGIGRTGTFVGIDIGMRELEKDKHCDPLDIIGRIRRCRGGMVQTSEQYKFVHRALEDYAVAQNASLWMAGSKNLYGNIQGKEESLYANPNEESIYETVAKLPEDTGTPDLAEGEIEFMSSRELDI